MAEFFDFTVDESKLRKALERAAPAVFRNLAQAFRQDAQAWQATMARRFRAPLHRGGGRNPNTTLHTRTGALRRSLGYTVGGRREALELRIFAAGTPYARLQEKGGTIRPRRGRYLAMPIDDNLTPSGVPRFPSPRAVPGAFVLKTKSGALFIVRRVPGNLEFLFRLIRSATIPARLGFADTWNAQAEQRAARHSLAVKQALAEATR